MSLIPKQYILQQIRSVRRKRNLQLCYRFSWKCSFAVLGWLNVCFAGKMFGYNRYYPESLWIGTAIIAIISAVYLFQNTICSWEAACFLDAEYQLAERVTSSYILLKQKTHPQIAPILLDDTVSCLQKITDKKNTIYIPAYFALGNLLPLISLATIIFIPQITPVIATGEVATTPTNALTQIAAILQQAREYKLADEISAAAKRRQRRKMSQFFVNKHLQRFALQIRKRQGQLQSQDVVRLLGQYFQQKGLIEEGSLPHQQRIIETISQLSPQKRRELADKLQNLSHNQSQLANFAQAVIDKQTATMSRLLNKIAADTQRRLAGLENSAQIIDFLSLAAPGSKYSEAIEMPKSNKQVHQATASTKISGKPSTLAGKRRNLAKHHKHVWSRTDYLKKAWWPKEYRSAVLKYFEE